MAKEAIHNEKLLQKLSKLSPDLQKLFLKSMRELYDQESAHIRRCIEHGRQEISDTINVLDESDEEEDYRGNPARHPGGSSHHGQQPRENRRGVRSVPASKKRSSVSPAPFDPSAAQRSDTPVMQPNFEQESKEIMETMKTVTAHIENERSRQAEMVRRMQQKKKATRHEVTTHEDMMFSIMNEADQNEQLKRRDKERQERKVREMIEERKRERYNTPDPFRPDSAVQEDTSEKKKKKKKEKQRDDDPIDEEDEDDHKKEKKKNKHKKNKETADSGGEEDGDKQDKKKKKKKKKSKRDDDDIDL